MHRHQNQLLRKYLHHVSHYGNKYPMPLKHATSTQCQPHLCKHNLQLASSPMLQKVFLRQSNTLQVAVASSMTRTLTSTIRYMHSAKSSIFTLPPTKDTARNEDENALTPYGRPLGASERKLYHSIKGGQEIISLMFKVQSEYAIRENVVAKALDMVMLRHPLLRMSIQASRAPSQEEVNFTPREDLVCDFYASDCGDWLNLILTEIKIPFDDDSKPLWRLRMLSSSQNQDMTTVKSTSRMESEMDIERKPAVKLSNENNNTQNVLPETGEQSMFTTIFVFILHHSIMDGTYSLWLFNDIMRQIDAITIGSVLEESSTKELPLLPPMETYFCLKHLETAQQLIYLTSESYLEFGPSDDEEDKHGVLQDYNIHFSNDILNESKNEPSNSFLTFRFSKQKTGLFVNNCKVKDVSVNGAFVTASILALIDLIYPNINEKSKFEIPFEYMVDLRRYYAKEIGDEVPAYPGLMSWHIPLKAYIMGKGYTDHHKSFFWTTAKRFGDSLKRDIDSPYILQCLQDMIQNDEGQQSEQGKSPFVLCLNNMGRLDHVIQGDFGKRIRLVDYHGNSTVLINDMPLFFVSMYTLSGQIHGNISYSEGYTSFKTASEYMSLLLQYLYDTSGIGINDVQHGPSILRNTRIDIR